MACNVDILNGLPASPFSQWSVQSEGRCICLEKVGFVRASEEKDGIFAGNAGIATGPVRIIAAYFQGMKGGSSFQSDTKFHFRLCEAILAILAGSLLYGSDDPVIKN